jgi:hypothetical protein
MTAKTTFLTKCCGTTGKIEISEKFWRIQRNFDEKQYSLPFE